MAIGKHNPEIIVPGSEWRKRVIFELEELTERLARLRKFMTTEDYFKLPDKNRQLLREQSIIMLKYADVLTERLEC